MCDTCVRQEYGAHMTNAFGDVYARTEVCFCNRGPHRGAHPKGAPDCIYEKNR